MIIAVMIITIKIILIGVVILITKSQFPPCDFSTGSTTDILPYSKYLCGLS